MDFQIDELKYSIGGQDFRINEHLTVYVPYVYEVMDFGESLCQSVLNFITQRPYDLAVELDDNGIDYQQITEWDLFSDIITQIPVELTCIYFGKVDFREFIKIPDPEKHINVLVNKRDPSFVIDEVIYRQIVGFLRYIYFLPTKVEYDVGNSIAKKFLLDRMRRKKQKLLRDYKNGKIKYHSTLALMIKYCVNSAGFKYDYETVKGLKINQLYESYHFIVHSQERNNLLTGVYGGTIDASKLKDKQILDILPDLHKG